MTFELWKTIDGDVGLVPAEHTQKDLAFGEDRELVLSFEAVSWAEACQRLYDYHGWGKYKPLCPATLLPYDGQ